MLKQKGATLIELVITIVVVSVAVITLMVLTSQATSRSVDPMIQEQANAIARAYLEEITQKNFCDPDALVVAGQDCVTYCTSPVCGSCFPAAPDEGSRPLYDDICDYQGLNNSGAVDQTGSSVPGLGQYTIAVGIQDDNSVNLNGLTGSSGKAALITVTVTHPAMPDPVKLSGYRTNY